MCIAVIKPKNVEMPDYKTLKNCFTSNPHGAGFMYSDGNRLVIQKGYMTFPDFYTALSEANLKKEQLVFLHFRIATHGLRDGGNTHPFPVTNDVNELRSVKNTFNGYGLIHNGIIHYDPVTFKTYDPTGVSSDTMLFSMILSDCIDSMKEAKNKITALQEDYSEENMIAYRIITGDNLVDKHIDAGLSWNKIAIMDSNENFVMFGDWIEDNGMFYSNHDYQDYDYRGYYGYYGCGGYDNNVNTTIVTNSYEICCSCGSYDRKNEMTPTIYNGYCCEKCKRDFGLIKCKECQNYAIPEDLYGGLCRDCKANDYRCEKCDKKASYLRSKNSKLYCQDCYETLFESNRNNLTAVKQ